MFPYAKYANLVGAQSSSYAFCSVDVSIDFLAPVFAISLGKPQTARTPMPKATIDKHGEATGRKPEIRNSRDVWGMQLPSAHLRTRQRHAKHEFC